MMVPQVDSSFSDSLRLGYERGIILMKEIKKTYPSIDINISINTGATSPNSQAIITFENKKVSK